MNIGKKTIAWVSSLLLCAFCAGGCVTRELYITTEPKGASVLINDTYTGTTPMTHRFVHYQTFGIRLEKEGYHPLYVKERIASPLYQRPGIDLISEAFWPRHIKDQRELHYTLAKVETLDDVEGILSRAAAQKSEVEQAALKRAERDTRRKPFSLPLPLKRKPEEKEEATTVEEAVEEDVQDKIGPEEEKEEATPSEEEAQDKIQNVSPQEPATEVAAPAEK